jgi:cell division protease FtsH
MSQGTAPRDLLARAYLDIIASEEGTKSKPLLRSGNPEDPIEALLEDLAGGPEASGRPSVRVDVAATAVLVARAIETVQGLTRDLRRGRPVVTLATHGAELVASVEQVLQLCAFGAEAKVLAEGTFRANHERPVLLLARDGTDSAHKPERGNDRVAAALHARAPIVGVAPDPKRHLPRDLQRAAEHNLTLGELDVSAVALVIEAVTGSRPTAEIDRTLVRAIDVSDLTLAVRADREADECIRQLEKLVATKSVFDHRGPSLEELAGYGEAQSWGLNLAADLREYRAGRLDWENIEKGLLLVGEPGVGKTQFARALAKTANVPLVATSVADWNAATFLSGTLAAIKSSFAQARKLSPCLLFIDELDGISDRAKLAAEYREYWVQIVNLLLEQLAGVEDRPGVVVIGATNHVDHIDPAIRRAGRLDRTIVIERPDIESLIRIFRFHLGADVLRDVDLTPAALAGVGGTGADVEAWVRRSKGHARRDKRELTLPDLLAEVRAGRDALTPKLRRACAVHEAGHLTTGVALQVFQPQALSIADEGGKTRVELTQANQQTQSGIEDFVAMLLSGRAAEELLLGSDEITAGAGASENSDFARATRAVIDLELRTGFGTLGVVHFSDRVIDLMLHDSSVLALIKHRLDKCMARAREVVARNRSTVEAVAARLEESGYLDRPTIESLLAQHPVQATAPAARPQTPFGNGAPQ